MEVDYVIGAVETLRKQIQKEEDRKMMRIMSVCVVENDIKDKSPVEALYLLSLKHKWELSLMKSHGKYMVVAKDIPLAEMDEVIIITLEPKNG